MKQIKNDKPLYENEKYQIFNDKNGKYVLKLKKGKKVLEINIVLISLYYHFTHGHFSRRIKLWAMGGLLEEKKNVCDLWIGFYPPW